MKSSRVMILLVLSMVGCTSLPYKTTEPTFTTTEDIFQKIPIWDSTLFSGQQSAPPAHSSAQRVWTGNPDAPYISRATSPGLWTLLTQVDPGNRMLLKKENEDAFQSDVQSHSGKAAPLSDVEIRKYSDAIAFADANQAPLPAAIQSEPLTRAYVISLAASIFNARLETLTNDYRAQHHISNGAEVSSKDAGLPSQYELSEGTSQAYSVKNFETFGQSFLHANLDLVQRPAANQTRLNRIHNLASNSSVSLESLMFEYFSAYYKGNFVDRDGGALAKPTVGTTISDTTISNAATVALEAMFDYAALNSDLSGAGQAIKAPVVYDDSSGTIKWQTAKGGEPTLVSVIQTMLHNNTSDVSVVGRASIAKLNRSITVTLLGSPTGGDFTITIKNSSTSATTAPIKFNATANIVQAAIVALVTIPESVGAVATGNPGGPYQVTLPNGLAATVQADGSGLTGGNNIATLTIEGKPSGGTFTITVSNETTKAIAFNAPASAVAAAIGALPSAVHWPADPVVTGGAGGPYQVTLPSGASMTANPADLTGGSLIKPMKYALEKIQKNGEVGITPAKIKIIRYIQGVAGDGAQGLSGLIVRTFGGVHIGVSAGLGLLGKVSIGDNNTLASLLEAAVGTIASRSSEFFASTVLYDVQDLHAVSDPPPAILWLKNVSE